MNLIEPGQFSLAGTALDRENVHVLFYQRESTMLVRVVHITDGPGPSERVVGVLTSDGHQDEVVISKRQGKDNLLDVGSPLMMDNERYLIELPRESISGKWRIWVPRSEVVEMPSVQAAE